MRIALIGAAGQLGSDLLQVLSGEVVPVTHRDLELTSPDSIQTCLTRIEPDLVINTAAYNLVDAAEDDPQTAFSVNALGPRLLARFCDDRAIPLVHFSTDYVFGLDADRTSPWRETDCPGPLGVYAASKLAGEQFVQAECRRHFILRTCGLYGLAATRGAGKGNFIETMLRLAGQRRQLRVVHDQHCTPTATIDLARAVNDLIQTEQWGLYHATSSGATTWFELATEIFRRRNIVVDVQPVSSSDFGAKARRPSYSVLNCDRLATVIGWSLPSWTDALDRYLAARPEP